MTGEGMTRPTEEQVEALRALCGASELRDLVRAWQEVRALGAWQYLAVLAEGLTVETADSYNDPDRRVPYWRFVSQWHPVEEGEANAGA